MRAFVSVNARICVRVDTSRGFRGRGDTHPFSRGLARLRHTHNACLASRSERIGFSIGQRIWNAGSSQRAARAQLGSYAADIW
jgi:hypothetical protein